MKGNTMNEINEVVYAIEVVLNQVLDFDGYVVTPQDLRGWLICDEWGEVDLCVNYNFDNPAPKDAITFDSEEEAHEFMKRGGHPWWLRTKSYKVVKVGPLYERVVVCFDRL